MLNQRPQGPQALCTLDPQRVCRGLVQVHEYGDRMTRQAAQSSAGWSVLSRVQISESCKILVATLREPWAVHTRHLHVEDVFSPSSLSLPETLPAAEARWKDHLFCVVEEKEETDFEKMKSVRKARLVLSLFLFATAL